MTRARRTSSWRAALSLFTIIPVRAPAELDADTTARAMFWLPAVGLLVGLVAAGGLASRRRAARRAAGAARRGRRDRRCWPR